MIEDPGSFSGSESSPKPQRGPDARNLMSLAIFMMEHASTFNAPETSTIASCAASASNLLGAVTNGRPVSSETCNIKFENELSLQYCDSDKTKMPNISKTFQDLTFHITD